MDDSGIDLTGRRIAVTGGGGFVGTPLVAALVAAGAQVTLLGPTPWWRLRETGLVAASNLLSLSERGLDSPADMTAGLAGCDSLIHLRYRQPSSSTRWTQLTEELSTNLAETVTLLGAADEAGLTWCAFASSASVYAPSSTPVTESATRHPQRAPYAMVKGWAEDAFARWEEPERRACSLRLSTVYGPGETGHRAIPRMVEAALAGRPLVVDAGDDATFDPVFVHDVAQAFVLAAAARASGPFNVPGCAPVSVHAVAERIVDLTGSRSSIELRPSQTGGQRPICDPSRAREVLGFTPQTTLTEGLRQEIAWWRDRAPESP